MINSEIVFPSFISWSYRESLLPKIRELYNKIDWDFYLDDRYPNGVTTYFKNEYADVDIIKQDCDELISAILQDCYDRISVAGKNLNGKEFYIQNLWLSRMFKNGHHIKHIHHGSHFSGTFYVNGDADSSPLLFYDPRLYKQFFNELNDHDVMSYDATPGKLMMWDSFLEHEVQNNNSETIRDAISFNVGLR